jgi:two-component system, sensor histidine kinase and response regulator
VPDFLDSLLPPQLPLAGLRVLLADSNAISHLVVRNFLESRGAQVEVVTNGQMAMEHLQLAAEQGDRYDLMLIDPQLPLLDGLTLTRTLRQDPTWAHLPVIALVAGVPGVCPQACRQAGMNDAVGKPFDMTALMTVVLRWCGRLPHAQDPLALD